MLSWLKSSQTPQKRQLAIGFDLKLKPPSLRRFLFHPHHLTASTAYCVLCTAPGAKWRIRGLTTSSSQLTTWPGWSHWLIANKHTTHNAQAQAQEGPCSPCSLPYLPFPPSKGDVRRKNSRRTTSFGPADVFVGIGFGWWLADKSSTCT